MTGICEHCHKECQVIKIDNGIGHYEFWGARGFDSRPEVVSSCCNAGVYNDDTGQFITLNDLKHYEDSERSYYED